MFRKKNLVRLFSIVALVIGLAGCATVKKEVDLVWPLPPDEPKIKFVELLRSNQDVEEGGGYKRQYWEIRVAILSPGPMEWPRMLREGSTRLI